MMKLLSAAGLAAALMFAVPQAASALPGQGTGIKAQSDVTTVGHKRYYKHRHWKRGHHHHNRHRYYRKRKGIHIHVH